MTRLLNIYSTRKLLALAIFLLQRLEGPNVDQTLDNKNPFFKDHIYSSYTKYTYFGRQGFALFLLSNPKHATINGC